MTTKQVLYLTATFLGKEDLLNCPYFTGEEGEISAEDQKELDILNRCLNLIVSEISTDYLPIYKQKNVSFVNKELKLNSVDENIYQIVKIQNEYGSCVRFKIYDDTVKADVKKAIITYTSFADKCELGGDVENFSGKIADRVLAYGTAMEYSFISSLYDDATIWESRYKNALLIVSQKKHNVVMPKRGWF